MNFLNSSSVLYFFFSHRYDGFEKEMNANASRIAVVNQLARQLLHVEHPDSQLIQTRQAALNQLWSQLREKVYILIYLCCYLVE